MILQPGTPAPAFTLNSTPDQTVSLADFRGQPLILAFYPADWSPVCGDQVALYNEILPEFRQHDAALLGISVDGVWCHHAFAAGPHAALPAAGRLRAQGRGGEELRRLSAQGRRLRAGALRDRRRGHHPLELSSRPIGVNPGADGILEALESLPAPHDR